MSALETYFQEQIASEIGVQPAVDCGSTYRVNRPGDSFECAVSGAIAPPSPTASSSQPISALPTPSAQTTPSQPKPVLVEVVVNVDQQGNVNWQQIRRTPTAQAASTEPAPATDSSPGASAASSPAPANGVQPTPASTSSEAETAEDFLDSPNAMDGF